MYTSVHSPGGGPNSACDVGLPLELTSGLERDWGVSSGLGGVLTASARHREKLGLLSIGFAGSGCARVEMVQMGLGGRECWVASGWEGSQEASVEHREDL